MWLIKGVAATFCRPEKPEAKDLVGFLHAPILSGYKRHSGGPHLHGPIFLQQGANLQEANDSTPGAAGRRPSAWAKEGDGHEAG